MIEDIALIESAAQTVLVTMVKMPFRDAVELVRSIDTFAVETQRADFSMCDLTAKQPFGPTLEATEDSLAVFCMPSMEPNNIP